MYHYAHECSPGPWLEFLLDTRERHRMRNSTVIDFDISFRHIGVNDAPL